MSRDPDDGSKRISTPLYTLSVASRLSGVPAHSIRQYIDRGLILPFRKVSNRHLFSDLDIIRLEYIHRQLTEKGLNIAGIKAMLSMIPCWKIHPCSKRDRENCSAYHSDSLPCWEASEKGPACRNLDCRECAVYQIPYRNPSMKSMVQELVP